MTRTLLLIALGLAPACSGESTADPKPTHVATTAKPAATTPTRAAPPAATARTASTGGASAPDDWAPSTGREMPAPAKPTLDRKALAAQLAKGVALARTAKDKPACNAALAQLYPAAVALDLEPTAKTAKVFEAMARCARKTKRYQVLEVVARSTQGTQIGRTSDLATALIGQDRRAEAARELDTRLAASPRDPFLLAAQAKLACAQRAFAPCRDAARRAIASHVDDPELASAHAQAQVSLWLASLMLGDYATARAAAAKLPIDRFRDALTKLVVPAERIKLAVDVSAADQLALGVYHLAGTVNPAPLELTFGNADKRERQLRIELEIPGVTTKVTRSVVVLGKGIEHVALTPPLMPGFAIGELRAPRRVQLDVRVFEGGAAVFEQSMPVELLPRDYLPTWHKTSEDTKRPTLHNLGAWITPNEPAVEALLTTAKQRLVGRQTFSGPQAETLPQVQALYDELKARGVSYVMDPAVSSDQFLGQRTRLPVEVIASTNAQCLEGTLLFATLLEAIGLEPIVVTVPGHAFVGWRASPKDGKQQPMFFVETTMVHTGTFASAVKVATARVASEHQRGSFKTGAARLIHVRELRAKGITPQPSR